MATTRIFYPRNRLAQIIGTAGDPTAETLERAAVRRVEALKDKLIEFMAEQLAVFEELARVQDEVLFAESLRLEAAALSICETAGSAGLEDLGEAARGVSAMVQGLVEQGVWHSAALKLHMDAVAMLASSEPPPAAETHEILANLRAMRERIGIKTSSAASFVETQPTARRPHEARDEG